MLRPVLLVALLAFAAPAPALAADDMAPAVPTLKRAVTVSRDLVRIGDLVDNAGAVADVAIFRAPDLGSTGTVATSAVLAAIKAYDLVIGDTGGIGDITVTRESRAITVKDIEARIARAFAGRHGFGDAGKLSVSFDRDARTLYVEPSATADLEVVRAYYDPRSARFDITFNPPGNVAARPTLLRYTGSLMEKADVAVLVRPLGRGEIARPADVVIERRPKSEVTAEVIGSLDDAVGFAARQPLRAGQPLRRADLMKPEIVKRDEIVTLVYAVPGILLTIRGKALESGGEGDVIDVLNTQSKRTVQGTVSAPGLVTIASTMSGVAMNTAAASPPDAPSRRTE